MKAFTKSQSEVVKELLKNHFKGFQVVIIGSYYGYTEGEISSTDLVVEATNQRRHLYRGTVIESFNHKAKVKSLKSLNILKYQQMSRFDEFYTYHRLDFVAIMKRPNGQQLINEALTEVLTEK